MSTVRCVGLDVHAETIAVAVAEPDGEVRSLGVTPISAARQCPPHRTPAVSRSNPAPGNGKGRSGLPSGPYWLRGPGLLDAFGELVPQASTPMPAAWVPEPYATGRSRLQRPIRMGIGGARRCASCRGAADHELAIEPTFEPEDAVDSLGVDQ